MGASNGYLLQFYAREPDDMGIDNSPHMREEDLESTARRALLGYFNNPRVSAEQRPKYVRVVTCDGFKVVFTLMATGPDTAVKV
jgi:hypothetical protein